MNAYVNMAAFGKQLIVPRELGLEIDTLRALTKLNAFVLETVRPEPDGSGPSLADMGVVANHIMALANNISKCIEIGE